MSDEKDTTTTEEPRSRVAKAARNRSGATRPAAAEKPRRQVTKQKSAPAAADPGETRKTGRSRRAASKTADTASHLASGAVESADIGDVIDTAIPANAGDENAAAVDASHAADGEPGESGAPGAHTAGSAEDVHDSGGPALGEADAPDGVGAEAGGAEDGGLAEGAAPASADAALLLQPEGLNALEFAVRAQDLKAGLAAVVGALPGTTSLPILNGIRIETGGVGQIRLTATDLDTTVSRVIAASVSEPGSTVVRGKKFDEVVKALPDGCVLDLRLKEDAVHLWCSATRYRCRLPTMPAEDFPMPPGILWEGHSFATSGDVLRLMVERTAFAASTEETRPILNGVLWEFGENDMGMVATNGHRLSATHVEVDTTAGRPELIVHPSALKMVAAAPGKGEMVEIARTENHIGFRGAAWEVITRLMGGPYPLYRQILPSDNDKFLIADRTMLAAALARMNIVASEQTHRVMFSLGENPGFLTLSVETPDVGTASEQVAVEYEGEPLQIGFNAKYLLELLAHLPKGVEVMMSFKAPERAATIKPREEAGGDGVAAVTEMLIMPLRLIS